MTQTECVEDTIHLVDEDGVEASAVGEIRIVQPSDTNVSFTLELKHGPAFRPNLLKDEGGHNVRSACFVAVERLGGESIKL